MSDLDEKSDRELLLTIARHLRAVDDKFEAFRKEIHHMGDTLSNEITNLGTAVTAQTQAIQADLATLTAEIQALINAGSATPAQLASLAALTQSISGNTAQLNSFAAGNAGTSTGTTTTAPAPAAPATPAA